MAVAGLLMLMLPWLANAMGGSKDVGLQVIRQNKGDVFSPEGQKSCRAETCVGLSSGTASAPAAAAPCTCQCHPHLPAFREDLRICVDDIHECILAPFVGGSTSQSIPFVFLPLKGQIIHPSKEISFSGIQTPVCAVSGAKFLTDSGWVDLRNPVDTDVPFRLFRDEGRTFLQWVGESDLRTKMSGRLVLVYLMCRELATTEPLTPTGYTLFSPCVAFRVVGSPTKYLSNVSEVAFSPDAQSTSGDSNRLSVSEYVAIGTCSVLLGLIYVASVFLYVHLRKRNKNRKLAPQNLTTAEEGVVKNNPLLKMAHFQPPDAIYSESTSSDAELTPDVVQHGDDKKNKSAQLTSALVHSQYQRSHSFAASFMEANHQDQTSIEKLPEENVSIVETLEGRDERIDSLKALSGTVRRKLYFNPAYFDPQLLMAPPPAALEFLAKIREVIAIAKQKMAAKKFAPSLMGIPEEDHTFGIETMYDNPKPVMSRNSSMISLKRENSRRKTCSGCPGCQPQNLGRLCGKLPELPSLGACQSCSTSDCKQRSIRKWLEDVPVLKNEEVEYGRAPKRLRSPTRSLPDCPVVRTVSPRAASERAVSPISDKSEKNRRKILKPKLPPPPPPGEHQYDSVAEQRVSLPPPDMIHEAMVVDQSDEIRIPTLTKKQMKAVIEEFAIQRGISVDSTNRRIEYETDSLERSGNRGYSTPSEYAELSSSQPSPSLSTALPMDEEMTIRNAVVDKHVGNLMVPKVSPEDEHDYELIVLKKGSLKKQNFYKLPELLQRSNGYSLVSEVYVNNGYNYGSAPSSPSDSNCSTFDRRTLKVRYEDGEKPGKLLIEVKDCADHYIPVHDSDGFEPDTLDRKPAKLKLKSEDEYIDSLERPSRILLRSNGSFKKTSSPPPAQNNGNFNRVFGSLREIYEAKTKKLIPTTPEGRLLTLEDRHSKRQRRLTAIGNIVPPDLIPPPPLDGSPIYEKPKPPRKVLPNTESGKPPLPPKNVIGRSASRNLGGKVGTPEVKWSKQEDPGYLSDSSGSPKGKSESEESLDGHSESGAESVETHSVFFGTFRKPNFLAFGSMDSGVDSMKEPQHKILVVSERSFS